MDSTAIEHRVIVTLYKILYFIITKIKGLSLSLT